MLLYLWYLQLGWETTSPISVYRTKQILTQRYWARGNRLNQLMQATDANATERTRRERCMMNKMDLRFKGHFKAVEASEKVLSSPTVPPCVCESHLDKPRITS